MSELRRLVVIGAGDLGGQIAARFVQRGGQAVGLTHSTDRHTALASAGVAPSTAPPAEIVRPGDIVVLSTSGSESQERVARELAGLGIGRLVFVSTTGFYTGRSGRVGIGDPPADDPRAQAAAQAEQAARAVADDPVIVRLGGLYRLGRGPVGLYLRTGVAPLGPPDRPLALIHRDDAAEAVLAAALHPAPLPIYLGVTPPLPTRRQFYELASKRHDLPLPAFSKPTAEPPIQYDVRGFRHDLLPDPAWPDWREATRG